MERIIENEFVKAVVADHGAELISLINKETGEELLWNADPAFWARHAPVLFPNVGRQFEDQFLLNGTVYPSKMHGFARDSEFDLVESSGNALSFVLESNSQTKELYPFEFSLGISYTLEGRNLKVTWKVVNEDKEKIYFTIGGHPAFNTIPEKRDYSLYFPEKDSLTYKLLNTDYGCVIQKSYTLELENHRLHLNDAMFEKDALIFDDMQISDCILEKRDGTKIVAMHTPGFENYGIWSKPKAPYICLEPWCGRADDMDFKEDISKKHAITGLDSGEEFVKKFSIEVL